MARVQLLVIDDDSMVRAALSARLQQCGYDVEISASAREGLERADELQPDLALVDYRLPDGDGLSLLQSLREVSPDTVVIMMTGYSSIDVAVEAMRQGAFHYVTKPADLDEVAELIARGLETNRLRREVRELRRASEGEWGPHAIVGESAPMQKVRQLIQRIARSQTTTVLITGETGTGKDLIARAVHYGSGRTGRFINITCSAIPEHLLESELFGHERGAFTNAGTRKIGLLEEADGGTVFLDEIGEMSVGLQAKLLRFLEDRHLRRLGSTRDVEVDVRVLAATHRDLADEVKQGRFREDLYYRLRVLEVVAPALREREGDIRLLTKFFVERHARELGVEIEHVTDEAMRMLEAYRWPGNVRELRNAVERAVLLAEGPVLTAADFPLQAESLGRPAGDATEPALFRLPSQGLDLTELEVDLVRQALSRTGGNRTRAAALLGLNRDQIRYRIEKYGLENGEGAPTPANGTSSSSASVGHAA